MITIREEKIGNIRLRLVERPAQHRVLASNFYVIARNELSDQMIAIGWCKAMERVAAEHYFDCSCDREVARQLEEPVA